MSRDDALAAHATKFQAHVTSLEERITNPTEVQVTSGPSGSFSSGVMPVTSNYTI